jgi:hypothetical protein
MNILKTLLASSIALAILGTAGCSDGEDQDSQEENATSFTGLVVDGRVARGFVWVDINSDGAIDTFEPYAYTDATGYYSYNPETNTNYCEDTNHQYCLNTGMVEGDFIIRITGGVDLSSGEPFTGIMTLNSNLDDAKEVEQQVSEMSDGDTSKPDFIPVVSPLTTLTENLSVTEKVDLLTKIGVTGVDESNVEELLSTDFTNLSSEVDAETGELSDQTLTNMNLYSAAFEYQKTVEGMTALINSSYKNNGLDYAEDTGGPALSIVVANALNESIAASSESEASTGRVSTLDVRNRITSSIDFSVLGNTIGLMSLNINTTVLTLAVESSLSGPVGLNDQSDPSIFSARLSGLQTYYAALAALSDNLTSNSVLFSSLAYGTLNSVASQVQSAEFLAAAEAVAQNGNTLDIKQLADDLSAGVTIAEAIANATLATAPEAGEAGIWAQRVLSMSGKSEDGERGRVMFFFGGEQESSTEGDVSICYAYNANDNDDDITAVLLTGTWQELGSRGVIQINNGLVSFTVKALKQAPIPETEYSSYLGLGDTSVSPDSTTNYGHLRFVNDGSQEVWFSDIAVEDTTDTRDFGLLESVSIPTTQAQCESFTVGGVENALSKNLGF